MVRTVIAPLLRPAVCLIIGITVGRYVSWPISYVYAVFILLLLIAGVCSFVKKAINTSLVLELACIALGYLLCLHQQTKFKVQWPTETCNWQAVVTSEPVVHGKTIWMDALLTTTGQKIQLRLMHDKQSSRLTIGNGIVFEAVVKPLSAQGSYRTFQETRGYVGETIVWRNRWHREDISLDNISTIDRCRIFFMSVRHEILKQISVNIKEQDDYAILVAMTLGDKTAVSREQKEAYAIAGTSHLLALSGLHLGIIYMLLARLFRKHRRQLFSQLLTVVSIWAFVLLVGMPSSVVRAATMISIYAFVSLLGRSKTPINTLALTAIIMLGCNPYALFDVGFQLSFAAVLAILLFVPIFDALVSCPSYLSSIKSLTAVTVAAQIGTAPLVAFHFGRFSPWFLLSNYVSIPLVTVILYLMLLLLLTGFWPVLQAAFSIVPATLASWLNGWTSWVASLPLASIDGLHPSMLQVTMLYVLIGCSYWLIRYHINHSIRKTPQKREK